MESCHILHGKSPDCQRISGRRHPANGCPRNHLTRLPAARIIPPMNSLTVYALSFDLARMLDGATLIHALSYPGVVTFSFDSPTIPHIHLASFGKDGVLYPSAEPLAPAHYGTEVLKSVSGARIGGVRALGLDRVLLIDLVSEGGWGEHRSSVLRMDLKPAARPVSLFVAPAGRLIESIGPARAMCPATPERTSPVKRLSILELPDEPPAGLLEETAAEAGRSEALDHTRRWVLVKRAATLLVDAIDGVDPVLARAVLRKTEGNLAVAWPALTAIGRRVRERRFSWHTYDLPEETVSGRGVIYPVPLDIDVPPASSGDPLEILSRVGETAIRPAFLDFLKARLMRDARKELRKLERLGTSLSGDLKEAERSREYRHLGNLLATHRHVMRAGMDKIEVRDYTGDRSITIRLEPARSPDENIRRYYARAKKGEKGLLIIKSRKREAEREIRRKRGSIERLSALETPGELFSLLPHARKNRGRRDKTVDAPRFRTFALDKQHTVYVGRSKIENDILTHRFASPTDLWFHAQGTTGSHVILKGATPSTPKRIIEQAAAIAAHFSKARHSNTVPVVYTEKRYVRKPRKSPPGTASYLRGTTLFVTPCLPVKPKQP